MKTLKNLFLVLCASVLFASCGGGGGAESVAKDFQAALSKADYAAAKQYCGPEYAAMLDQMIAAYEANPEMAKAAKESSANIKSTFVSCVEDAAAGTAVATFSTEVGGQKMDDQTINLKKIDNAWKVVP